MSRFTRRCLPLAMVVAASTSGCWWGEWGAGEAVIPPSVDDIALAAWPPMNGSAELRIDVSDDRSLQQVYVQFHETKVFSVWGTADSVFVRGDELGEGMGTVSVAVTDGMGGVARRELTDLVVDLSPPEVDVGKSVLRASGDALEMWVSDAWVLGSVVLQVGDAVQRHDFPEVYPATLGEAWDYSLVQFPTDGLPLGVNHAVLTVRDAAGNELVHDLDLTVDGNAPAVAVQAPLPGAVLSGAFEVAVAASDDLGGPVWLDVEVDGTPLATAIGPSAVIGADAGELAVGTATLRVRARDEAGNETVTEVPIAIE